ncbi:PAAR domain-containing protein [Pseudenhygromyxa sp. WMMC2535]|uniref:PAAR domain-containing protein n=1 Tax=Pseudenhygromyxa sp. WMMC2535 TaxID=2712867 RepID=UPI001556B8D2|nr:PAAR domain-containing protein [Pseudenhygromyxa sp. WMMC2535]NVB38060.1 PAAR domain-containing protein [Pseudenhygromyxa sp. WMMC2535]
MPFAARVGDPHLCPATAPIPHIGGVIMPPGVPTVLIGSKPAATVTGSCLCPVGPPNSITKGSTTVTFGNKPAARMGDPTAHGGLIIMGCPTVLVGG